MPYSYFYECVHTILLFAHTYLSVVLQLIIILLVLCQSTVGSLLCALLCLHAMGSQLHTLLCQATVASLLFALLDSSSQLRQVHTSQTLAVGYVRFLVRITQPLDSQCNSGKDWFRACATITTCIYTTPLAQGNVPG